MNSQLKQQLETMNQQAKELAGLYHIAAGRSGISDNEFWVWYALLIVGGAYSQQDICNLLSLSKQTVNSIISNLARKGFVALEPIPGTRNRKVIRVSEEGRRYGEAIVTPVYEAEQAAFLTLPEQDRQRCVTLLGNYLEALRSTLGGDAE